MKFENISLEKFNSVELSQIESSKISGGVNTYEISAPPVGDGTITDATISNDDGSQWMPTSMDAEATRSV